MKAVIDLLARRVDPHPHGNTSARHVFVQRTQIARQGIGQHRHDTIREIGRITTLARLAVERGPRGHIMRHISNRDPKDMSVGVLGIIVGLHKAGIVAVARIPWIDGDQRQVLQVFAALNGSRFRRVGFGHDFIGEMIGDAMLVDRDQRHGTRCGWIAKAGNDPCFGQAHAPLWAGLFGLDQFAVFGTVHGIVGDRPFIVRPFFDRQNTAPF